MSTKMEIEQDNRQATKHYNLRSASSHNRQLPARTGHLTDANLITRLLYKDSYY